MPQRGRGQLGQWSLFVSHNLPKYERRGRTTVPKRKWEVDEGLFTKRLSGTVVLLDDIVDLADGGRDQSNISKDDKGERRGTYRESTKARIYQCLDQKKM